MLAKWIEVPYKEVRFFCAGINHQAFFLEFRHFKKDLYPRIREAVERPGDLWRRTGADRFDEAFRVLRHRIERPRERICSLFSQE